MIWQIKMNENIKSPEECLNEAKIVQIELEFLHKQSILRGWDIGGEIEASECLRRAINSLSNLSSEATRMKNCLLRIDEETSKWHENISMNVCEGAFPHRIKNTEKRNNL